VPNTIFSPFDLRGPAHQVAKERSDLLVRRDDLIFGRREERQPCELRLVQRVVVDDQPRLGVEIRPALGHQSQVVVRRAERVLDLRTASQGCCPHRVAIRVHERAQTLRLRLIAGRVQLLL
jgi:hypothetical protein